MKIHLIVNPNAEVFGIYIDGKLIKQARYITFGGLLNLSGLKPSIIAFSEEDMIAIPTLPASVYDIPITGLLAESATLATLEEVARKREEKPPSDSWKTTRERALEIMLWWNTEGNI